MVRCDILASAQIQAFWGGAPTFQGKVLTLPRFWVILVNNASAEELADAVEGELAEGACAWAARDDTSVNRSALRAKGSAGINLAYLKSAAASRLKRED